MSAKYTRLKESVGKVGVHLDIFHLPQIDLESQI